MIIFLQIIAGLALLTAGGEGLVRGSVALAKNLGIPTIFVGLTVVSVGTSAPELFISIHAVLKGLPDIALGNVIGSNIANILLVMGAAAVVSTVNCPPQTVKRDGMIMFLVTVMMVVFCIDGAVTQTEGFILLAVMMLYLLNMFRIARKGEDKELVEELEEETQFEYPLWQAGLFVIAGGGSLVLGADILVDGATALATALGVPESVIALTIVAIGTSAPELVTAMVAAYHRHGDIVIGNVVGSNIFNIFLVLGTASLITGVPVAERFLDFDLWIMLAVTLLLIPVMLSSKKVTRIEGSVFLGFFALYTTYLYWTTI